jgi:hypothetical protein
MALGSTQILTEMNLSGGKGRPARKAYILTAICAFINGGVLVSTPLQAFVFFFLFA